MKKKIIIISSTVASLLIVIFLAVIFIRNNKITVSLVGEKKITIDVFSSYKDKGIKVTKGKKDLSVDKYKYNVENNVNTDKVGKYRVNYNVKYKSKEYNLKREVEVIDKEKPVITLSADTVERDFCTKKDKNPINYTATDNYDDDLTKDVVVKEDGDKILYTVTDSSGNKDEKEVSIKYTSKPKNKFTLNGRDKVTVIVDKEYKEQGASYTDGCDKKIDSKISISSNVDTSIEGVYTVTYSVKGEEPLIRTVVVTHYQPKNIYLTFDDGPGVNTSKVLSELDKYHVKATFFVTDQFPKYRHLIGEEYRKGHAIGVHTLTHKWSVYDSLDNYINDFNEMNEIIHSETGSYTKIFRFPGGSSNTVSKSHAKGIVTEIANEMTNRGYVYYDWNLSSGDADSKATTEKIINNILNRVDSCRFDCVILFHDYKKTTANAIGPILEDLTSRGYTFKTLDENGPITHSKINN